MARAIVAIPAKYKEYLEEELTLVRTLYDIQDYFIVKKPNRQYYIPYTRLEELKNTDSYDVLVILDKLKPRYTINLYRELRKEIADRVQLILKIFAEHAGSKEARLQIELAKLKHELPLIREVIRHMKLGELPGFLGGGRYAVDKYYRMAKSRIARIMRELEKQRTLRSIRRAHRRKLGLPHVALVGYTCAGKTTLFNYFTNNMKPVGPEPFTTLSPKASAIEINGEKIVLVDTVGFIRDIPPEIIEAFYATLEEIIDSELIVLILDASRGLQNIIMELNESRKILSSIGVHGKPIIIAINKIDKIHSNELHEIIDSIKKSVGEDAPVVPISALKGYNLDKLAEEMLTRVIKTVVK